MPQLICRYSLSAVDPRKLRPFGVAVCPLVAEAASTEKVPFKAADIEWLPQALEAGAFAPPLSIELRTIGRPERKAKLNQVAVEQLKTRILALPQFPIPNWPPHMPLIWVQFTDPDGVHV